MEEVRIIGMGEPTEEEKKLIEAQDSCNPDEVDVERAEAEEAARVEKEGE